MKPHAKLFVSSASVEGVFGEGKWRLLRAVQKYGSIQKAAAALGRGYRKAWGDIRKAEEAIGEPLVVKKRGGVNGGGADITEYCERLLDSWDIHRRKVFACVDASYDRHLGVFFGPRKQDGEPQGDS